MIEIFVLIGWFDGFRAGGIINQEFFTKDTCEAAKALIMEKYRADDVWYVTEDDTWLECVKK